jgi:hypothetical protein
MEDEYKKHNERFKPLNKIFKNTHGLEFVFASNENYHDEWNNCQLKVYNDVDDEMNTFYMVEVSFLHNKTVSKTFEWPEDAIGELVNFIKNLQGKKTLMKCFIDCEFLHSLSLRDGDLYHVLVYFLEKSKELDKLSDYDKKAIESNLLT